MELRERSLKRESWQFFIPNSHKIPTKFASHIVTTIILVSVLEIVIKTDAIICLGYCG